MANWQDCSNEHKRWWICPAQKLQEAGKHLTKEDKKPHLDRQLKADTGRFLAERHIQKGVESCMPMQPALNTHGAIIMLENIADVLAIKREHYDDLFWSSVEERLQIGQIF